MPEDIVLKHARITWADKEYLEYIEKEFVRRLYKVCEKIKIRVVKNISVSGRKEGPSEPGQYPHADTGRLRNTIFVQIDEKNFVGRVGTPLDYGLWLEYGTKGGKKIMPKDPGGVLSWVDRNGVRHFAKWVIQGPIEGRSYLRRTMIEMKQEIEKDFTRPIGQDGGPGFKVNLG